MKKLFLLILASVLMLSACKKTDEPKAESGTVFENRSSYTVTVSPYNTTAWQSFTVAPNSSYTLKYDSFIVSFTYAPAFYVTRDNSYTDKVVFVNR